MRKLLVLLAVFALVVAFTVPAIADERLKVSGGVRVRAWDKDNYDDMDSDDKADDLAYWDQRFRLGGTINVAEGISGHFRVDLSEDKWGSDNFDGTRYDANSELQVDRAYMQIDQNMYTIKAGQLYQGLGNSIAVDQNKTGFTVDLKLPVKLTVMHAKFNEGGAFNDEEDGVATVEAPYSLDTTTGEIEGTAGTAASAEDEDFYALNAAFGAGPLSLNVFYAMLDNKKAEDSKTVIGVQAKTTLGGIALNVELNMFGGSDDATDTDYIGTQLYANAEMGVAENVKVGADLFYAQGTDAAGEEQLTYVSDWGSFSKDDRGPLETDINAYDEFDPAGASAGVMGFGLYVGYTVIEPLLLQAHVGSFSPQEDVGVDSITSMNISATYTLATNTTLAVQYNNTAFSADDDTDAATCMTMRFQLNF